MMIISPVLDHGRRITLESSALQMYKQSLLNWNLRHAREAPKRSSKPPRMVKWAGTNVLASYRLISIGTRSPQDSE